eukprot:CAMPEP_0206212634 /NCGR_PEP_ID=MMETSP0047_2-20121206/679_1 /ASSEMBLY_ACC=CAM_ASM_000192 /TAXON_ID=195065 /ORGANISM="Chroomonas mesostigmatica_cf, Strain CCMP1168" /LENGTH=160 /DNA_ID=CAMNT_0053634701 /DNA_START=294 /DNA_END=773 /DNA_ORIENTATION=-
MNDMMSSLDAIRMESEGTVSAIEHGSMGAPRPVRGRQHDAGASGKAHGLKARQRETARAASCRAKHRHYQVQGEGTGAALATGKQGDEAGQGKGVQKNFCRGVPELSSEAFQPAMTPIVAAPVMIMADAALPPPFFCATVVNALATLGEIIFTDFSICLA